MSAEPVLSVKGLSSGYPRRPVLHDVSFEVLRGEVVALLGPNGSGKSTLLKTITGSPSPSPGSITISGRVLESLGIAERARRIGFVPQEEHSVFGFSARQVVLMGRMAHSGGLFESHQDLAVAEVAMRAADCWDFADRAVTELSGGEAQRVLIARALAQEPELLLLDEPSSHLDVSHQEATARLLRDRARHGMGVLVAVHDLNYAARIADRAILLHNGCVKLIDSIRGVLQSSALDDVYQVQFQRIAGPTGECLLIPSVTS